MNTLQENKIPVKLNFRWRLDGENNDYIIYQHPVTGMLDILNPVATDIFIKCDGKHTIGEYQHESQVMIGPMMRKCAEAFFVDKLFIGTDGFSIDTGFTGNDYMRCEAVKDMARQASHVIIVTESDKFHQKGVSNLIDLHQVSCIYTDQGIPQEVEEYFKEKHIQVEKV